MNTPAATSTSVRLYYLDWLRVMAFSILLLEHSVEIFVNWKFWIKNDETSTFLSYLVAFFLPWRMPLLFLISGAAVTLSFKRKSSLSFLKERSVRLLLPLVFAVCVIIPPQIYFIKVFSGYQESFWTFFKPFLQLDWKWSPQGNIHFLHLWYLSFLFLYCIIFLPVLQLAKKQNMRFFISRLCYQISKPYFLFSLGGIMVLPYFLLSKVYFSLYPTTFIFYFPFFVCGAILWTDKQICKSVKKNAVSALVLGILLTISLYFFVPKSGDPRPFFLNVINGQQFPLFLFKSLNLWFWVLAIFGLAMRFFNYGSRILTYATQAVYPFYILHQTVIVIVGYYTVQLEGSLIYKLFLVTFFTFISITIAYEGFIKKSRITCLLFGVNLKREQKTPSVSITVSTDNQLSKQLLSEN